MGRSGSFELNVQKKIPVASFKLERVPGLNLVERNGFASIIDRSKAVIGVHHHAIWFNQRFLGAKQTCYSHEDADGGSRNLFN
jgi:hypothetical protein